MGIVPPTKEPSEQKSVRLSKTQWARIQEMADSSGNSLSEVVQHFVRWCFQELDRVKAGQVSAEARFILSRLDAEQAQRLEADLSRALKRGEVQP